LTTVKCPQIVHLKRRKNVSFLVGNWNGATERRSFLVCPLSGGSSAYIIASTSRTHTTLYTQAAWLHSYRNLTTFTLYNHACCNIEILMKSLTFLQRDAMRKRGLCCGPCPSVCLSVRHVRAFYPDGWRYGQTSCSAQ